MVRKSPKSFQNVDHRENVATAAKCIPAILSFFLFFYKSPSPTFGCARKGIPNNTFAQKVVCWPFIARSWRRQTLTMEFRLTKFLKIKGRRSRNLRKNVTELTWIYPRIWTTRAYFSVLHIIRLFDRRICYRTQYSITKVHIGAKTYLVEGSVLCAYKHDRTIWYVYLYTSQPLASCLPSDFCLQTSL